MSFLDFIVLFSGLALFLYGMRTMGNGLEKAAGDKMQKVIEAISGNLFKGVLAGTIVTALIQSSSATTVMVVGFVNAGVMKLTQAVGIIMGANIGTTITSQLIRLGDIDKNVWYLAILNPKTLAPVAIAIGVFLVMFARKRKSNNVGEILTGFGILFIGMATMEGAVSELRNLPQLEYAISAFSNPVLGVIVGAAITVILQSSSASVGILQAVAAAGLVNFASAVPIILGQNIGTCVTALLSSIGTNRNARKAAMVHLFFNIIGTGLFLIGIYAYQHFIGFSFWEATLNRGGIADIHTVFNISNTLILLPFAGLLVKLAHLAIKDRGEKKVNEHLDERFLSTPSVAVSQAVKEVVNMGKVAQENVNLCTEAILNKKHSNLGKIEDNEDILDNMESNITKFLIKVADKPLNKEENKLVSTMFHIITDIERIGDHCTNIGEISEYLFKEDIEFSDTAKEELKKVFNATQEIIELALKAYEERDVAVARRIQPCEDIIDLMKETLRISHIDRLAQQKCNPKAGVIFLDIINNLERISDHCSNIGVSVEQLISSNQDFDPHKYLKHVHQNKTQEYKKMYEEYEKKYGIN